MTKCILVVEQDIIQAHLLELVLSELGYRVVTANNPELARQLCQVKLFDLALLNVRYRGHVNGISLADELWRLHLIPSILLTGERNVGEITHREVLYKPYTNTQIAERVSRLVPQTSKTR